MVVLERKLSFHRQIAEPVAKKKKARRESKCGGPFDRRPRLAATRPRPEKIPFRHRLFEAANFQRKSTGTQRGGHARRENERRRDLALFFLRLARFRFCGQLENHSTLFYFVFFHLPSRCACLCSLLSAARRVQDVWLGELTFYIQCAKLSRAVIFQRLT